METLLSEMVQSNKEIVCLMHEQIAILRTVMESGTMTPYAMFELNARMTDLNTTMSKSRYPTSYSASASTSRGFRSTVGAKTLKDVGYAGRNALTYSAVAEILEGYLVDTRRRFGSIAIHCTRINVDTIKFTVDAAMNEYSVEVPTTTDDKALELGRTLNDLAARSSMANRFSLLSPNNSYADIIRNV